MSDQQFQIHQSDEIIRSELLKTLEYYFSSKNLSKDDYLLSQMDDDYYVPLDEIAKFNKIKNLTNDINVIKEVIKQSSQLELDPDTNNKVRSINGKLGGTFQTKLTNKQIIQTPPPSLSSSSSSQQQQQQRSVLILREVSPEATYEKIIQLFENKEPMCPACEKCESAGNDSWYVTFCNEDQAQRALQYLKGEVQFFMDRPIKARIKAHAMPRSNTSGIGFNQMNLTPSSTPPPPPSSLSQPSIQLQNTTPIQLPISPHNNNNNQTFIQPQVYTPTIAFIPAPQFNQINSPSNQAASIIIQANHPHHPGYEYAPALFQPPNWPAQPIIPSNSNVYITADLNQPINSVSPLPTEDKSQIENQNLNTSSSNGSVQSSPSTLILSNTNSPKSVNNTLNQFVSNSQNNFSKTAPSNYAFHTVNASPSNSPALISQYPNYNPTNHHTILTNPNHAHYTTAPNLPHGHFIIQANLNHHHHHHHHQQQHNFHNNNTNNNQSSGNNHHPSPHTLNQQFYQPGNFNHFANQGHFSSLNINTPSNLSFEVDQKSFNHQIQVPITLPFHTGQQNNSFGSNQPNQPTAPAFAFFYNSSLPPHPIQSSSNPNIIYNPILPGTQHPNQQIGLVQSNSNQTSSSSNNNNNNTNTNTVQFPSSSSSLSSSPKPSTNNNNTQQSNQRRPNTSVDSSKNNNNTNQKYTGQRSKFNNQSTHSSSNITINNNNNTTLNRNHNHYQNSTNTTHYQHSYTNNLSFYESNSSSGISTSSALSSQSNTPIQQNSNFNKNNHHEHNNVQTDDLIKRNKSPLIINSDLSFPPLNSSSSSSSSSSASSTSSSSSTASSMTPSTNNSKNVTISLQNLPVNKQKNENQEAPIDPAIISCYKSADFIPNSPTIIKSNTIIDSKSHDSKKATSETLANILNQTNEYKNSSEKHFNNNNNSFHQRNKYDSYQRNPRINSSNRNSNNMKKVSNDSNRHMRVSNSNQNINSDQYHDHNNMRRKNYDSRHHNNKNLNSENTHKISISISANEQLSFMNSPSAPSTPGQGNEEEIVNCLNSCWNKKLTFAEIVQKAGSSASPSPTLMNKLNNTDTNENLENALEYNSTLNQTIITTD
ncbi:unnamed protein product [Brachionus calyciflorus]|uniref:HTH La-type RNA-binding domain-containing protein n=1 Tax=Brachionus calyciflorus TaxID=104777 RepID=A0A813UPK0_9BILA|nr:unnamed protein product [Brachionus calyciflorus]